jgi:hypothetical protein
MRRAILIATLSALVLASCAPAAPAPETDVVNGVRETEEQASVRLWAQRRFKDGIYVFDQNSGLCHFIWQDAGYSGGDDYDNSNSVGLEDVPCTERVLQLAGMMSTPIVAPEPPSGPAAYTAPAPASTPVMEGTAVPDVVLAMPAPRSTSAPRSASETSAPAPAVAPAEKAN